MSNLNLRPATPSASSSKPIPSPSILKPWIFEYISSSDGHDTNLLVMFHGLGDTKAAFTGLGRQLNLPSTAILSLQGPDPLPLMDHPSFSWYNTFTTLFEPLPNPSPAPTLPSLRTLLTALTSPEFGWDLSDIHLFGWGQGGSMALELALDIGKSGIQSGSASAGGPLRKRFGSVISICAPLLSFPTTPLDLPTPVLYFTRQDPRAATSQKTVNSIKRVFKEVTVVQSKQERGVEDMPRSQQEWRGIIQFWGEMLKRGVEGWKGDGEVYEVVR